MRGGLPLSYRGPGVLPGKNFGNCGAGEAFFKPVLGLLMQTQDSDSEDTQADPNLVY